MSAVISLLAAMAAREFPIEDDFNRANGALGSRWSVQAGSWQIVSNKAVPQTASFAKNIAIHRTPTGSLNQWVRITWADPGTNGYGGVALRWKDAASPFYLIDFKANAIYWSKYDDVNAVDLGDTYHNIIDGDTNEAPGQPAWPDLSAGATVGFTLQGTGTDTILRIWFDCTGEPDALNSWNSEGPFAIITLDPIETVDDPAHDSVGICAFWNGGAPTIDDFAGGTVAPGSGGGGGGDPIDWTDDFTSLANWTSDQGTQALVSGQLQFQAGSFANNTSRYTTATTGTSDQYIKVKITTGATQYPTLIFRAGSAADPCYAVQMGPGGVGIELKDCTSTSDSGTVLDTGSLTIADGNTIGATITGTGSSMTVRLWKNPTGLPLAADNWDGDTSPDLVLTVPGEVTIDPAPGFGLGLRAYFSSSNVVTFDDFAGGDIPV